MLIEISFCGSWCWNCAYTAVLGKIVASEETKLDALVTLREVVNTDRWRGYTPQNPTAPEVVIGPAHQFFRYSSFKKEAKFS